MRFDIVSLFPELFEPFLHVGLVGKAVSSGVLETRCVSPRRFTRDKHQSVDDTPYGGGSGMVMMPGPVVEAMEWLDETAQGAKARRILLTPAGRRLHQQDAERWAALPAIGLICGRYEGIDDRVREYVDEEISLGDFVLNGGEVAALAVIEATARWVPGVLGNQASVTEESHAGGLLEYPQYTRPRVFRGHEVPNVLLSGDHAAIAKWRRTQALERTRRQRPDLLDVAPSGHAGDAESEPGS